MVLVVKKPLASARDRRDTSLIPGSGRFSGGENGNPLQYSYLDNSMDSGAWQAMVHMVEKVRHDWSNLMCMHIHTHTHTHTHTTHTYTYIWYVLSWSVVSDSATPWTVACQALLSMAILQVRILVGCHALFQGIFPIWGLNSGFLHCKQILYHLSHQGSPCKSWGGYKQ